MSAFNFHTFFAVLVIHIYAFSDESESLQITFDPPGNRFRVGTNLTIRCETNAKSELDIGISVFFFCPIAPWGSFCFQNCKSACAAEDPGQCPYEKQLAAVKCRTVVEQDGRVLYEYKIERVTRDWFHQNGFYCKSAGTRTSKIVLEEWVEDLATSPTRITKAVTEASGVTDQQPIERPRTTPNSISLKFNQTRIMHERTSAILRELLVVFAILIVLISIIANIFCCIRCALIRQYSKCKHPPRMQNLFCMAEEIRNARLGSHSLPDYWDANRPDVLYQKHILSGLNQSHVSQLQHLLQEHTYTPAGSYLATSQGQILAGNPALFISPDLLASGSHHHTSLFTETNSNTSCGPGARLLATGETPMFSITPESSVVVSGSGRQSKSTSVILVPGPNGLQILRSPSSNQNSLASAVANYCTQQQHNLMELQKQLSSQEFSANVSSRGGSDGVASCRGSVGSPDSGMLDVFRSDANNHGSSDSPLSGSRFHQSRAPVVINGAMEKSPGGNIASASQSDSGNGSGSGHYAALSETQTVGESAMVNSARLMIESTTNGDSNLHNLDWFSKVVVNGQSTLLTSSYSIDDVFSHAYTNQ